MSVHVLQKIPLFSRLSDEDLGGLEQLLKRREFAPGQTVFLIGEEGHELFLIEGGSIEISFPDDRGQDTTLSILGPGSFFGEISLLDEGARTASATAKEPAVLLSLERTDFDRFLETHGSAALHMVRILGQRQREMVERVRGIRNVNEAVAEKTTPLQRMMDKIANFGASQWFLFGNMAFLVTWVVWQASISEISVRHWFRDDPPTFFTLCFIIGFEAIMLTMFVLNSQKRSAERDRIRADLDYQVNVKAHREVMQLHNKVDRLEHMVRALAHPRDPRQ